MGVKKKSDAFFPRSCQRYNCFRITISSYTLNSYTLYPILTSLNRPKATTMAGLNAKAYAQLTALIEENGLSSILGGISNWTSANPVKRTTEERRVSKKPVSTKTKKANLLNQLKEEHPDWELGTGKGLSLAALKNAVETGKKPIPKKRPYFVFQDIVRRDLGEHEFSPTQVMKIIGSRWAALKLFTATNSHTIVEILNDQELLEQVAKNYTDIEEILKDSTKKPKKADNVKKTKKVKKAKKAKKTKKAEKTKEAEEVENTQEAEEVENTQEVEKVEKTQGAENSEEEEDDEDQPLAGIFCMSDEDEDSDDDDEDDE